MEEEGVLLPGQFWRQTLSVSSWEGAADGPYKEGALYDLTEETQVVDTRRCP